MKKNGRRRGLQRYQCASCGSAYQSKRRGSTVPENLWRTYVFKRQTVEDLSAAAGLSARQVRRKLKAAPLQTTAFSDDRSEPVILVMDTTYFGTYGVMVFRCAARRRNLLWTFVTTETVAEYLEGLAALERQGYRIAAAVCDGKKWLCEALSARGVPTQLCQFHLMKTVTRYLTRRPELQAGIELRRIMLGLPRVTETSFEEALRRWHERWSDFLKEKTVHPETGRW